MLNAHSRLHRYRQLTRWIGGRITTLMPSGHTDPMLQRLFCALLCASAGALAQAPMAPSPSPATPSFDCMKARGRIEKAICEEPSLSMLDRRLQEVYSLALTQTSNPSDVKRAQRRWLDTRDDCKDSSCLLERYATRLDELGYLTGRFPSTFAAAICARVVDATSRKESLAKTVGVEDINNDGIADRQSLCQGGTANIPCVAYTGDDGKLLDIRADGFEWFTYSALGRTAFRANDHTFIYYSHDEALEEPAYLAYITPANREVRVCDFDTVVGSAVLEGGNDVCAAIEADDSRVEAQELAPISNRAAFAMSRKDTQARSTGKIDIDNDGLEESLLELIYSSGAGRGCENNYFELLADDGETLASNSNAAAIRDLQGLSDTAANDRNCGVASNRLIRFDDKIYLERNASNVTGTPHELRILEGTAISTVCTFERQIRTRVKTLY